MFLQEARLMLRNALHADEHDAVIFVGNGVTGAVDKLINALNFSQPPVVFVGPHEHHSNLLPWREIAAQVIRISEDENGYINLHHLEEGLKSYKETGLKMIGCFSAVSNVTGIISDTVAISSLLHKYGALAFWDYATAGPYVNIDMHPLSDNDASKDAVFLSMHKFVGGVDAPGVLVAKRCLFQNSVPSNCGGGAVFFVRRNGHRYLQDEEAREEGGTPRVVGCVRAALAMELKQSVGSVTIIARESKLYRKVTDRWRHEPNLEILGQPDHLSEDKLAIFSLMIFCPETQNYLHHNFVAALLNDLFGIQARGGCACAGPYAQDLLGIDENKAKQFEEALLEDSRLDRVHLRRQSEYSQHEVLRPGFVRLNFSYFCSDQEVDFVMEAVAMVACHGWRLLPQYMFNPETGEWRHTKHKVFADRKWLGHIRFTAEGIKLSQEVKHQDAPPSYNDVLQFAKKIFQQPLKGYESKLPNHSMMFSNNVSHLRWFLLPSEAQQLLKKQPLSSQPPANVLRVRRKIQALSQNEIISSVQVPQHLLNECLENRLKCIKVSTNEKPGTNTGVHLTKDSQSNKMISKDQEQSSFDKTQRTNEKQPFQKDLSNGDNSMANMTCTLRKPTLKSNVEISAKFVSPPKRLFKLTSEAIAEFEMIKNEDKVLVCLSGGKDSLSLLHVLHQYQFYAKSCGVEFQLGAVTVDPMTSSYDPSPLIPYLKALRVTYFYEEQNILEQALETSATSICAFCSRMKRGRIYACARREGWNVLAFGQHLDDLAESFLMSAFHNGLLRTMKANYTVQEGDLRVIRPFIYVRETDTRQFAESAKLPVIAENCPACFEAPKERHRMKQLLASQEIIHPRLFHSLKEAMHPLYEKNRTGLESSSNHILSNEEL
uniref:Uncharacterized protein LOC100175538 n=1 Tax=Phallusia mammillata TaxID=59560 RepID=A0A6F9DGT8_9ASCI|nr:uncharacterized protein LOC100175538 [Phallusia mammillata]